MLNHFWIAIRSGWYTRLVSIATYETRRLKLRLFELGDAIRLHQILGVPGVLRYYPNPDPPDMERVVRLIQHQMDHWDEHGYGWWAVEFKTSGELIGWAGLQYLPETGEIEIGYLLTRSCWGQGLATEGAWVGMEFGFQQLKISTIIGIVHPENIASQRVLEKLGFQFQGESHYFGMDCYKYLAENPSS